MTGHGASTPLHRRRLLGLFLALPLLAGGSGAAAALDAAPRTNRSKIVFHVNTDDPEQQDVVLRNLRNHLASVGPENLDIKVLLQGGGVTLLLLPRALPHTRHVHHANATTAVCKALDELRAQGVVFLVSAATLVHHGIDYQRDLYGVQPDDVINNALATLADLQQRGYTYIKP